MNVLRSQKMTRSFVRIYANKYSIMYISRWARVVANFLSILGWKCCTGAYKRVTGDLFVNSPILFDIKSQLCLEEEENITNHRHLNRHVF